MVGRYRRSPRSNEHTKLWQKIKAHPLVERAWMEREHEWDQMIYWVGLHPGWVCAEGTHTIVGQTEKDVARELRSLEPCNCRDCRGT